MVPLMMTNEKVSLALLTCARALNGQANRDVGPMVNALQSTMDYMLRSFVRMNPPTFLVFKVGEDP